MDHATLMDTMYRYQRYIYDITRKYYLLGRDRLLAQMDVPQGGRVLEMGCGTARNLIKLAGLRPDLQLFGLDISQEMLATARRKLDARGLQGGKLARCGADELDAPVHFGVEEGGFDAIFFSYALSMIPPWRESVDTALTHLKPGGSVWIVDFWDQKDLPGWFRGMLTTWLRWFHVRHEPALLAYLESLQAQGRATVEIHSVCRRYAVLARLTPVSSC